MHSLIPPISCVRRRLLRPAAAALAVATLLAASLLMPGCDRPDPAAPPEITYGVSICADCDMIINDERFASAVIIQDARGGPVPLLFDDIGDQIRYERARPELTILARWVHDYNTRQWLRAESAHYIRSPDLHTPMASGIAAFATEPDAEALAGTLKTDVLDFATVWRSE